MELTIHALTGIDHSTHIDDTLKELFKILISEDILD